MALWCLLFIQYIHRVTVNCSKDWHNVHIYKDRMGFLDRKQSSNPIPAIILNENRRKRSSVEPAAADASNAKCNNIKLPMNITKMDGYSLYNFSVSSIFSISSWTRIQMFEVLFVFQFVMYVLTEQEEGLYNLYFHSCPNYQRNMFPLNFQVSIELHVSKFQIHSQRLIVVIPTD